LYFQAVENNNVMKNRIKELQVEIAELCLQLSENNKQTIERKIKEEIKKTKIKINKP